MKRKPREANPDDYDYRLRDMSTMPWSVFKAFPDFKVHISGPKMTTDKQEIAQMFSRYGEVMQVQLPRQPLQSKQFTWLERYREGFVKFKSRSAYESALAAERVNCKLGNQIDIKKPLRKSEHEVSNN